MNIFIRNRKPKEIKYRYSIRDANLLIEETQTGEVVWEGRPQGKVPVNLQPLYQTNDCIVLVDHNFGFDYEKKRNNIFRCDPKGNVLWIAELPVTRADQTDFYHNMRWFEGKLVAVTWTTFSVTLSIRNGIILKQVLTR